MSMSKQSFSKTSVGMRFQSDSFNMGGPPVILTVVKEKVWFQCYITGLKNLFLESDRSVSYMLTKGYSTYESKTAVLLSTHLHPTHWDQVLFTVVEGCQKLQNTPFVIHGLVTILTS